MQTVLKASIIGIAIVLCSMPASGPALGQNTCGTRVVKAAGASAVLEGSARSKARSAWMRRVSTSKRLGPDYATWLRAREPHYECKRGGKAYTCVASAVPCKV